MNVPSNWRSQQSLQGALVRAGIPAIEGVDTRMLTSRLRDQGTLRGYLSVEGRVNEADAVRRALEWGGLDGQDYAAKVTCKRAYRWDPDGRITRSWGIAESLPPADLRIVAYDFGIKWNILRGLRRTGMDVTVVPARTPAADVLALKPDGVFLSNGPADPAAVSYAIESARELLGKLPIMGICLGHQILGWAVGGRTYRLKFGHHGINHPVKDLATGEIEITSQNHNFAVDKDSLDAAKVEVTHVNLNDRTIEGLRHRSEPMFCVQYHPEAGPGPHDSFYLFQRFRDMIEKT
jgi:carbamoyl-phosphate synthase small subunit